MARSEVRGKPVGPILRVGVPVAILLGSAFLLWWVFGARPPVPSQADVPPVLQREADWYPLRDWNAGEPGRFNLSVFVYRDRNQDGVYDPDDLPMAAAAVLLERPDGSLRVIRTNINGYANFGVHAGNAEADIGQPEADHHFEVKVPSGWYVTSGNARQSARFTLRPGTPAGMVTETPPAVIGLAPLLTVSGSVADPPVPDLRAIGPDGRAQPLDVDAGGRFAFAADPGPWRIERADDARVLRAFEVGRNPVALSRIDVAQPLPAQRPSEVLIDFEGFERSVIEKLAHGYRGLGWDYLLAIDNQYYQGPGYVNVLSSGRMVGYSSSGYPVSVTGRVPEQRFDFTGAHFGVAWPTAEGDLLHLEAWRDGHKVYADALPLSHLGAVWFQADYRDIDRLRLHTQHYWQFVTDDMRFATD